MADETNAANEVKQLLPVLVVIGNPPYSISSSNKGDWIEGLMNTYKKAVRNEHNIQPLSDDYIKFIRLAQDRIERTEQGVVGIITNHAYLSGLVHRGMREELMKTFTAIYVLNLHGNATIGETVPDGNIDENVFDIRQGVAIALFIKEKKQSGLAEVNFFELWGKRERKYEYLRSNDINTTDWQILTPQSPHYFFVPKDFSSIKEYELGYAVTQIFNDYQRGVATRRDHFMVAFDKDELEERFRFFSTTSANEEIEERFGIKSTKYWSMDQAREIVRQRDNISPDIVEYAYRPFDNRFVTYIPDLIEKGDAAYGVMQHMLHPNKAILCFRRIRDNISHLFLVVDKLVDKTILSSKDNMTAFPLYLYPTENATKQKNLLDISPWPPDEAHGRRVPNFSPKFVEKMAQELGLTFTPNSAGDLQTTFGPEDIFHYMYAIFNSSTYYTRYVEFLKIDFPRLPLTSQIDVFQSLCGVGKKLVHLHLLESPKLEQFITRYPIAGDNWVEKGYPKYVPPREGQQGRVNINKQQYFEGVTLDVWEFYIGGYQPAQKWLKDRRGRELTFEDILHYQKIIIALKETDRIMKEIDAIDFLSG